MRITSQQVFAHLQAPCIARRSRRAELAELERQRQVAEIAAARRGRSSRSSAIACCIRSRDRRGAAPIEGGGRRRVDRGRARAIRGDAAPGDARGRARARDGGVEAQRRRSRTIACRPRSRLELRQRESEARDREGALEAVQQRRLAEISQLTANDRVRELVTKALPQIAQALHHLRTARSTSRSSALATRRSTPRRPHSRKSFKPARSFGLADGDAASRRIAIEARPPAKPSSASAPESVVLSIRSPLCAPRSAASWPLLVSRPIDGHVLREQRRELDIDRAARTRGSSRLGAADLRCGFLMIHRAAPYAALRRCARRSRRSTGA